MADVKALYDRWSVLATADPDLIDELRAISGDDDAINDRFYRELSFGTAGLRGVIGAGINRMNVYTVGKATQGLADYLNSEFDSPSVAIGRDSRIKSDLFAETAARVLAANGVRVLYYDKIVPTPLVSWAVRRLGCSSGIVITASHNPSEYNGYKCYDERGYQMTDEAAAKTYAFIQKTETFGGIKTMSFAAGVNSGLISFIDDEIIDEYINSVLSARIRPDAPSGSGLGILYSPLNGTGNLFVRRILREAGHANVRIVEKQKLADGNFPTCPFPNPEIKQVFEQGIADTADSPADLIIATDPDCDRMGIAVRGTDGEYVLMTGNEVGAMLAEYICSSLSASGKMPADPFIIKSVVTTDLADRIIEAYGGRCVNTLTGFKYIGEYMTEAESAGKSDSFLLGFEESYGYLRGMHVRDKDAVVSSMLVAEMACAVAAEGMSLIDYLESIYAKYGYYENRLFNFMFPGESGMNRMSDIMTQLREHPPTEFAGKKVVSVSDCRSGIVSSPDGSELGRTGLPSSNVLIYSLEGGCKIVARPAGTEPKLKIYSFVRSDSRETAAKTTAELIADMRKAAGIDIDPV